MTSRVRESFTEIMQFAPDVLYPISHRVRLALFLTPIVMFWISSFCIYWFLGWQTFSFFFAVATANLAGGGRFLILTGAVPEAPMGVWELAALIAYTDLSVSCMLLAAIPLFCQLPFLGRAYVKMRRTGLIIIEKFPWLHKAAFLGVTLFVAVPLQGTGAIVGTVLARITGMSRIHTILSVGVGGILGAGIIAACADAGKEQLEALWSQPVWGIVAVIVLFLTMYVLGKRITTVKTD